MSALREVLAVFDIIVNDSQLEASNKKLDTFVEKLKGIGAAFAAFGIVKSIASFGEHVAESARAVEFNAGRMEMGTNEYQRLAQVANNYGMSMEQLQIANTLFTRALSGMGGTMGTFSDRTGQARDAMRNLGLDAKQFRGQRLEQILPVISDAFVKIEDPMERVAIGLRLFGHRGRAIMPMMAAGGEEIRRQFAAAVPVFEELTIKAADEATIAGKQLSRTWDNLVNNSFGKAILDTFTIVARKLTDVTLAVKDLIKNSEIGKGILFSLGIALMTAAGIAVAAWWPVLVPILAVLAAFAALALAIDDFIVFMKGGDSVIGDFFDALLGPGGAEKAQEFIKQAWETFKGFLEDVKNQKVPEFLEIFKNTLQEIRDLINGIKAAWSGLKGVADFIANKTGLTDENIMAAVNRVKNADYGRMVDEVVRVVTGGAPGTPASVAPPASVSAPFSMIPHNDSGTGAKLAPTYVFHGNVDSAELIGKVRTVVDSHNNGQLRDAFAGMGGAK